MFKKCVSKLCYCHNMMKVLILCLSDVCQLPHLYFVIPLLYIEIIKFQA